jgi:hypothetical protein
MKVYMEKGHYVTDEGTTFGGKICKLDYLWIGSDSEFVGTLSDGDLTKIKKMIDRILKNKIKENKSK